MRYGKYVLTFATVFLFCMISNASALNEIPFSITADGSWDFDIFGSAQKNGGNHFSAVRWTDSTQSTNHKMWFRVSDLQGSIKGSGLLNYKSLDAFQTNLKANGSYALEAKREKSTGTKVTVSGTWVP